MSVIIWHVDVRSELAFQPEYCSYHTLMTRLELKVTLVLLVFGQSTCVTTRYMWCAAVAGGVRVVRKKIYLTIKENPH